MLGRTDLPLDEEGRAQALALAASCAELPLSAVLASPLSRATLTAQALAEPRGLPVLPVPGLVELDQGELDGQRSADLLARYADFFAAWRADPGDTRVPGGETLGECQERSWEALTRALEGRPPGPPALVVVHQMVLSSILCRALELPLRHYGLLSQRNTAMNLLGWSEGRLRVVALNLCEHLPPAPPPRRLAV